ncbi:MAG: alpha/beta hydrolase [Caldilineaceae bacterium]|nr:alpha/beta hydrolase [Caldilineaceae bacterium]
MLKLTQQQQQQLHVEQIEVNGLNVQTRLYQALTPTAAPPIVLLHGLLMSSRYLLPTAALLSEHHVVYLPDLPGFGESDNPPHIYSLREQADLLVAWLDALAIEQAIFLGNSLGSQILVDLAVRYPDRVNALILTAPTVDPYYHGLIPQFLRLVSDAPLEDPRMLRPLVLGIFNGGMLRALRTFADALSDPVQQKLPQVTAPTLVVRGDRDPVVSQRWVEEAVDLLPNAQLQVLADAPHGVTYSTPAQVASVVRDFLQED